MAAIRGLYHCREERLEGAEQGKKAPQATEAKQIRFRGEPVRRVYPVPHLLDRRFQTRHSCGNQLASSFSGTAVAAVLHTRPNSTTAPASNRLRSTLDPRHA